MATYDYVIVGGGSAGCVVAHRLGEDRSVRVLVIEAGLSDRASVFRIPGMIATTHHDHETKGDWNFRTAPQTHLDNRRLYHSRGKVLGGCSAMNGMLYVRGHRDNYDEWRDLGNDGWGYQDVLPYFKRAECHELGESEYHGGRGPLRVSLQREVTEVSRAFVEAAARACRVPITEDFNGARQEGAGIYHTTSHNRRRCSTAVGYLHPAIERGNVEAITRAVVTGLHIEGRRVRGVKVVRGGHLETIHVEREVVLSAGVFGSPQVLMLSGIGPADHLKAHGIPVVLDLPGVGQNLHDHLMVPMRWDATEHVEHRGTVGHFLGAVWNEWVNHKGWLGEAFLEGGAFVKLSPDAPRPNLQYHSLPWPHPEPNDDDPKPFISKNYSFTMMPGLIYPESRGTMRLTSADPTVAPIIDPNYLAEARDMQVLVDGIRLSREIAATAPLSRYLVREGMPGPGARTESELRAAVRRHAKTIYHPVGTCKMGPGADAVVDETLRVRGLEGLRIADASIMPRIVGGNTNAPTIMIGEKAADLVRGRARAV